ncbi:alpha/beta fold hydrolase [Kangiella geojedonensis]|uniref:Alpha/beta hydrolase n=1 Tax=Kangiella geojedonensis TaxID=914150 RepID=A0A0F6RBT3_9GAMM|nr:alpha/beta fold hydrolase [Kangiella geojedonensis]AKE51436.1 alpha/beta hydrolase [Kangiella geojedonensis]
MNKQAVTFILAHGAGADSQSEFMQFMKRHISDDIIEVVTFDFPYMVRRQKTGKKSPPDRMPTLIDAFHQQINSISSGPIVIGGKSMGGRVATMIADEANVSGVVAMGYPFHPPGKPEKTRTEHLAELETPSLILQGTRDTFGKPEEVAQYQLSPKLKVQWLQDGNHSLETLKRSEVTTEQSWKLAAQAAQSFIHQLVAS